MAEERRDLSVEEENAVAKERWVAEQRALRDAFLAVFGAPGKRTPHGLIILEHLEHRSQYRHPKVMKDLQERTDIYRTAYMEGRRDIVRAIHDAITWTESGARLYDDLTGE